MTLAHVFVETNFLFGIFRMPSQRHRDALALKNRFEAGEIRPYIPYVCFQEARNLISKNLPSNRCSDLLEFHRFAAEAGTSNWDLVQVQKFLDAATAEVIQTKAIYQRELADFAAAAADGVLHGTKEVFDFLEALETDDVLAYNNKLILSSVFVKAKQLRDSGERNLYFVSVDKKNLQPTADRPKLTRYYNECGLTFVPRFVLPDVTLPQP